MFTPIKTSPILIKMAFVFFILYCIITLSLVYLPILPNQQDASPQYFWDTDIIFSNYSTSDQYLDEGWSSSESTGTWTNGSESKIRFSIDEIPEKAFFTMNATAFTGPGLNKQILQISINKKELSGPIIMDGQLQNINVPVPLDYLVKGTNTITFSLPNATSPKSLGISEDDRVLGIAVRTIALTTHEPNKYTIGETISFAEGGNFNLYETKGWSNAEPLSSWTDGRESELKLSLEDIPDRVYFTMNATAFTGPGLDNQTLKISINNKELSDPIIMDGQLKNIILPLPSGYLVNGTNTITFSLPNATSPKSLGISEGDDRLLGISVRTIALPTLSL